MCTTLAIIATLVYFHESSLRIHLLYEDTKSLLVCYSTSNKIPFRQMLRIDSSLLDKCGHLTHENDAGSLRLTYSTVGEDIALNVLHSFFDTLEFSL